MPDSNDRSLKSRYTMQNLVKIHCLSTMSQNNHINQRGKENKLTKLSLWIMLRLYLQPNLETKSINHFLTRDKVKFLLKYVQNTRWRQNYRK